MPTLPLPLAPFGEPATFGLFGGNILAPRTPMTGPGSYAEAVEALGVTTMRYPGGSLTESFFDISDPDATSATDNETGERVDFMPLSDLMDHAAGSGRAVTIVIPTRTQLSMTLLDDNGDRLPDVDADELAGFVRDVVSGVYGDAPVAGFEIGNEYWGSGRMNAVEYGRLAAEMTAIIDSELRALETIYPQAAEVDILVQQGTNFGSSALDDNYDGLSDAEIVADLNATYGLALPAGGGIDWTEVNNLIVLGQFDDPQVLDALDGVVAHVYSRGPEAEVTRYFQLDQIEDTWQAADPTLEIHVTEWNLRSGASNLVREEDYGLYQAQEMLELVETFMAEGVDAAQVWPLIQNTASALSLGSDYAASTPPGEMFALMSENLPGMTMLDFSPNDMRDAEFETASLEVHGFADGQDMVFYITAPQGGGVVQSGVDVRALLSDVGAVEATVLGVAPGQASGDTSSEAVLERLDPADVYADGVIDAVLAPGEILQVRLFDVTPTAGFAPVFDATSPVFDASATQVPEAMPLFEPYSDLSDPDDPPEAEVTGAVPQAHAASPSAAPPEEAAQQLMMVMGFSDSGYTPEPGTAPAVQSEFETWQPAAHARHDSNAPMHRNMSQLHGNQEPTVEEVAAAARLPETGHPRGEMWRVFSVEQANASAVGEPAAGHRGAIAARDFEMSSNGPDPTGEQLMTLLSLSGGDDRGNVPGDFPDLAPPDESEPDQEGGPFDDMGLGWALAAMPLLALAGYLR
jgi:hypothetical protein